jgi:hypothetical protein
VTKLDAESREKSLERQIRAFHWVRMLAELPERSAGGDGEREAARRLETWLRELGFAEIAQAEAASRPQRGAVVALHAGLATLACLLGGPVAFALAALCALSWRRERGVGATLLSRSLPAQDCAWVAARAGAPRPRRRIVLSAPLDAPRAGRLLAAAARRRRLGPAGAPRVAAPAGLDAWMLRLLAAAALATAASALGATGAALQVALGALALACGVAAAAGLEWAHAPPSPGAAASASAVAAMLTCGEQLFASLRDDEELWLVGAGGQEPGACGMRAFLDAHARDPGRETLFVHFERLGGSALARVAAEVGLEHRDHPPRLAELARRVAESGAFGAVDAVEWVGATGAAEIAARGLPMLVLVSLDPDGLPGLDHQADDSPSRVDTPCVVRAADFAAAVVEAARRGESDPLAII